MPVSYTHLLAQSLAHATGFSSQWQNIGKIQNKGIELSLSSTNIQTKGDPEKQGYARRSSGRGRIYRDLHHR